MFTCILVTHRRPGRLWFLLGVFLPRFPYPIHVRSLPSHAVETVRDELTHFDDGDFISFPMVAETNFMKELLKTE